MQRELISLRILIEEYIIEDCWYNAPAERSLHVTYRFESCILQMKEESYQGYSTWFRAKIYILTHIIWLRVYHFPLHKTAPSKLSIYPVSTRVDLKFYMTSIKRLIPTSTSILNLRISQKKKADKAFLTIVVFAILPKSASPFPCETSSRQSSDRLSRSIRTYRVNSEPDCTDQIPNKPE